MERLTLKRLILISEKEKHSQEITFCEGLNIILGDNKTGKSSIIKSIFYTLGCELKKIEPEWKELISAYLLFIGYGEREFCILRQKKKYQIFESINKSYQCIINTENYNEFCNCFMSILKINIPFIIKNKGDKINITPPLLFRFQYIDQDEGWNKIADSFSNVGYIVDWKTNTNKYVSGYLEEKYYDLVSKKATETIKKEEKKKEFVHNESFVNRITSTLTDINEYDSMDDLSNTLELLIVENEQLQKDYFSLKNQISMVENEIYMNQCKLNTVENNMIETKKDIEFAMTLEKELICPICGTKYENGLSEQMDISFDYAHCEKLKNELCEQLSNEHNELDTLSKKYNELSDKIFSNNKKIKQSQKLLSFTKFYQNKGQLEIYEKCQKQLSVLQKEIDAIDIDINKLTVEINKLKSKKRSNEIKCEIESYCAKIASVINIPLNFIKLKDFVQQINKTGSEGSRLVYMYQTALYLYNLNRKPSPFNFIVIDTMNQQGLDQSNLESLFKSLELLSSSQGQVIIGTERLTGVEHLASNVFTLREYRKCLNSNMYDIHIHIFKELQKIATQD